MNIRKSIAITIIFLLLLTSACTGFKEDPKELPDPSTENGNDNGEIGSDDQDGDELEVDKIQEKIAQMTLEEKIGQLFIVGFEGRNINEEIQHYIHDLKVGGVIFFSRNIEDENQVVELINNIKEENSQENIPLFFAIDEEGGRVSRLPDSFTKLPEAMVVGKNNEERISYDFGQILGERIQSLGFNMNFAPVLDINSNPSNPVIGARAFGRTVNQVVDNGINVMLGIRGTNIIPVVKHFPGHGDTEVDSHVNLPRVDKSMDELNKLELIPFKEAINKNVEAIMLAHILYPNIDPEYPATMSKIIINDLLREELNYNGIVISDDMTMGAIVNNYSIEDGVVSFVKAGGDIALICHGKDNPQVAIERIIMAVESGEITEEEIDEKVYRILSLKEEYEIKDSLITDIDIEKINKKTEDLIKNIK